MALKSIAAAAVALPGVAQHSAEGYVPKALNAEQMKLTAELADLIIPRTDTPGASDARVHEYIDRALARNPEMKKVFLEGLARTERGPDTPFFRLLKNLTVDGYYTSKEGLTQELGWNGKTYAAEFKGCTHPEHQG